MMHIALDTNILRQDPNGGHASTRALARLSNRGRLTVHIPHFVEYEFRSQQVEGQEKVFNRALSYLSDLLSRPLPGHLTGQIEGMRERLEGHREQVLRSADREALQRLQMMDAERHEFPEAASEEVFEAYFEGAAPFAEPRARNDIPDGFIFSEIRELAREVEHLIAVVADKRLCRALREVPNVECVEDMETLLEHDRISQMLEEHDDADAFASRVEEYEDLVVEKLSDQIARTIEGRVVRSRLIPEDNNEARVFGSYEPHDVSIVRDSVQYYGDGEFVVQFRAKAEALLNYRIFKADYYVLSDERANDIGISSWSDHYYDAEEYYELVVEGVAGLEVERIREDESFAEIDVDELAERLTVVVDHIEDVTVAEDSEETSAWNP